MTSRRRGRRDRPGGYPSVAERATSRHRAEISPHEPKNPRNRSNTVTTGDWLQNQIERRRKDRPVSEAAAHGLSKAADRIGETRASLSELLAAEAEAGRAHQEYRTAVSAAFRDVVAGGGADVPRAVVEALMARKAKRTDGTTISIEDRKADRNIASDTNHADDITH